MEDFSFRGVLCSKEEADTCCWGATQAKAPLKRLYFKFPPMAKDEVRIRVKYVGLCHTDCFKIDEQWGPNFTFPLVPGHEVIAEIAEIGSSVTKFKPGDQVAYGVFRDCCGYCSFCRKGDDQLCVNTPYKFSYDPHLGGYSTIMQVKESFVFPMPPLLDKSRAAPILCAGATVYAPLKRWSRIGGRCAVVGIGELGNMAIQIANKMGMSVVAISRGSKKEAEAKALGAKEFVNSENEAEMKKLSTTERVDLMINTAFTTDVRKYMDAINPGGCFVQVAVPSIDKQVIYNNLDLVRIKRLWLGLI